MLDHCPGAANLRTPTLTIKKCPQCGEEKYRKLIERKSAPVQQKGNNGSV